MRNRVPRWWDRIPAPILGLIKPLARFLVVRLLYAVPYKYHYLRALTRNRFHARTILFYPDLPVPEHMVYKVCHLLGFRMTRDLRARADLAFHFEDAPLKRETTGLQELASRYDRVLNLRLMDIRKSTVDGAFAEAFGYSITVDPVKHVGSCFRKSELNAMHDGRLVACPVEPEPGYVYQRFIDTTGDDGLALDMRVPVMGQEIPFVRLRYRPAGGRYASFVRQVIVDTVQALSPAEQQQVLAMCSLMGADYAELDVLRDRDGRIYVVDVNDTPYARTPSIVRRTAAAFQTCLMQRASTAPEAAASPR